MKEKRKVLVIGLDGATFDLIKPWVSQGKLPTLAKLMKEGAHGHLKSVPNTNSAPAWVSFATGKNPGNHGIYYFDEPISGTYKRRYLNGSFRKSKAMWNYVSKIGKKAVIINVPMTYPAEKIDGCMISGLDTPGVRCRGFTYPDSLAKELQANLGEYIIEPGIPSLMKAGKKEMAVTRMLDAIDKRYKYAEYLMNHFSWDLFIVVFTAIDVAQHFFWKDMDPSHPEHNKEDSKIFSSTILKVYQRLDKTVSSLIDLAGNCSIILNSDHGAGFNQRGAEYLNGGLAEIGLLKHKQSNRIKKNTIHALEKAYNLIDKWFSREIKLKLIRIFPGLRENIEAATCFKNIDWTQTLAYGDGARDEIWINLKGREPQGIVQPGEEYEKLRELIIRELSNCHDVKNGKKVVKKAFKREEIYWGKYLIKAPDIFVQWRQDFVISGLFSKNRKQSLSHAHNKLIKPPLINGGHRENGILILHGSNINKNHEIKKARILDIAPTILYLLDIPVPKDMDGRVIIEAINENFVKNHPITFQKPKIKTSKDTESQDYSKEDTEKIKSRLKGMGYID